MMKVFIGGLPPDVEELDLVGFVSTYAEVSTVLTKPTSIS